MNEFYKLVEMRNPSRSYFVRYRGRLHSLKAVATFALGEGQSRTKSTDFHAADGAQRLRELRFDVVHNVEDQDAAREREWISRLKRDGQVEFRSKLIDLYGGCALSVCTTLAALEAAHVVPVSSKGADQVSNGILLRADLHKLFDANLIAIDPRSGGVRVSTSCKADYDRALAGVTFTPPPGGPALAAFQTRWDGFRAQ